MLNGVDLRLKHGEVSVLDGSFTGMLKIFFMRVDLRIERKSVG